MSIEYAHVAWAGKDLRLEYRLLNREAENAPLVVFLHEGLGSVAAWKSYPQTLCEAGGFRGLVYSRYGYGQSTPRPAEENWQPDYIHRQAVEVLPAFLGAVGAAGEKPWLFGHSDGATMALIYGAAFPDALAGMVILAPHIFVEDVTVAGIEKAREAYGPSGLRERLARHHADPDSAFWGWNDAWLNPAFRDWNIEDLLPAIRCPVLAIQGYEDEYATMAQLDGIKRRVPQAELLKLHNCGHAPHRDQPEAVTAAAAGFMRRGESHGRRETGS